MFALMPVMASMPKMIVGMLGNHGGSFWARRQLLN
jgi:hypothetical protein